MTMLRMVEAGSLAEDARVELIEGELIEVAPESVPQVRCRRWLTQFFIRRLAEGGYDLVEEISESDVIAPLAFPDLVSRVRDLPALD
ncbi:hypothetical protein CSW58_04615 [Caulobacter sp. B11]|nr:hypothetical protein CSW58_04615 [Caulobacter sp. B11]